MSRGLWFNFSLFFLFSIDECIVCVLPSLNLFSAVLFFIFVNKKKLSKCVFKQFVDGEEEKSFYYDFSINVSFIEVKQRTTAIDCLLSCCYIFRLCLMFNINRILKIVSYQYAPLSFDLVHLYSQLFFLIYVFFPNLILIDRFIIICEFSCVFQLM